METGSFRIKVGNFKKFLDLASCHGISGEGKSEDIVKDCVLRIDENEEKLWTIVSDEKRAIVGQIKIAISDIDNPKIKIPIEIDVMNKFLNTFENDDVITVIYENGIIALKRSIKKKGINFDLNTNAVFGTKRMEAISDDLLIRFVYGDSKDEEYIETISELGNSIYSLENDKAKLFFGPGLSNSLELEVDQLKKVIADSVRLENIVYPLHFTKDKLKVEISSMEEELDTEGIGETGMDTGKITRDLYVKKYNVQNEYKTTYPSLLSNALNSLSGDIKIFTDEDVPLLIISEDLKADGIDVCYLVQKY
jgi:hypothetical protein